MWGKFEAFLAKKTGFPLQSFFDQYLRTADVPLFQFLLERRVGYIIAERGGGGFCYAFKEGSNNRIVSIGWSLLRMEKYRCPDRKEIDRSGS